MKLSVFVLPHGQLLIAALPNFGFWKWILQRKKKNTWNKTMEENKTSAWITAEQNRKVSDLKQRGETKTTYCWCGKITKQHENRKVLVIFFFFFFFLKLSMNRFVSHVEPNVKRTRSPSEDENRAEWCSKVSHPLSARSPCRVSRGGGGGRREKKEHQKRAGLLQGCDTCCFIHLFFFGGVTGVGWGGCTLAARKSMAVTAAPFRQHSGTG